MTVLLYTLGVLLFVVGLAASIGLHELGHMVTAKTFGVKVTQYFIGFGKTIWSTKKGETEYGVKAVPLGGFVKLVGMLPPGPGNETADGLRVRPSKTGMFAQLISDARAAEYELVEPGDEERLFYRLPWWKKVIVMACGATVNIVLAFVLLGAVFMLHGVQEATTTVNVVSNCVIAAKEGSANAPERKCTSSDPIAPAKAAGLQSGDRVVSLNGTKVTSWSQFTDAIRANRNGAATIVVERAGKQITTHTNTTVSARPSSADSERIEKVGFLGVSPTTVYVKQGPGFVVTTMANGTAQTAKALAHMPVRLYAAAKAALGLEPRAADSPMSVVGAGRVAGSFASDTAIPVSDRLFDLLALLGLINLFIGMLNFVPLLPFDGGHIAGALYEAARRAVARLFRRPDPGYFDVAKLLPVAYVMAALIIVMSVVLVYADIVAPVQMG
jgi:membrane-associated protease RseP (regulator of RpoE activity)